MYKFTNDCLIGVEQIDNEHRRLFELVNETAELIKEEEIKNNEVAKLIQELNEYAVLHFRHEEEYMEAIQDPELLKQREMHKNFVTSLNKIEIKNLEAGDNRETVKELLTFISRWLFSHIISSDTLIGLFTAKEENSSEKKDPFAFTEEYHTGIAIVDEEHQQLFDIIRRANDLITEELLHDKYDEIMSVLGELREYTIKHFSDEEEYMESIAYEGLPAQKKAHEMFVDRLNDINLDDMDDNQQQYLIELVDFLLMWLVNHILKMDKKIPTV
ncbi:MAG: bacteriohemerythrin [Lachnospiraceae bacterium]|nr:bacteriohemerythrin [Lachnospiraceae bacterium]